MKKVTFFNRQRTPGRLFVQCIVLLLLIPALVFALDIGDAKQQGLVGERVNGYIAAVSADPAPEVQALVARINAARKQEYKRIAEKNGSPLSAVEKIAAKKAIEKTPAGQYVMRENGTWVKK